MATVFDVSLCDGNHDQHASVCDLQCGQAPRYVGRLSDLHILAVADGVGLEPLHETIVLPYRHAMGIKTEEKLIRGIRLITTTINVLDSAVVNFRLAKFFAPGMVSLRLMNKIDQARLIGTLQGLSENPEALSIATLGDLVALLGPVFTEIFDKVDANAIPGLLRDIFRNTIAIRDGVKYELGNGEDKIKGAFDGDQGAMWIAAIWVGGFNFASFGFGRLVGGDAPSKADSQSTSAT